MYNHIERAIQMFSSPETDKKIRIINILLSIVAVVLFLFFCFTVSNDSTKDRILPEIRIIIPPYAVPETLSP